MLKNRVLELAIAAVATTAALGLSGLGATTAFAATTAHPATTAAAVKPATVSGCTYGTSSGNIRTCFGINGSYTYVNSMWMTAAMGSVGRELHFELTGPSFTVNSETIYVACIPGTVSPTRSTETSGRARTTGLPGGGSTVSGRSPAKSPGTSSPERFICFTNPSRAPKPGARLAQCSFAAAAPGQGKVLS